MDRCEYSSLTIPNEISYLEVAAAYVRGVAKTLGFGESELQRIAPAVKQAIKSVIEHAYEPGEKQTLDVSCERVPAGLKIIISELGSPLGPEDVPAFGKERLPGSRTGARSDLLLMTDLVDEVSLRNRGPEGTEVHLISYLRGQTAEDYLAACEPEVFDAPAERSETVRRVEFRVRLMEPSEAAEVARSVYKAYGYSYFYEHAYYPERVRQLNESGRMVSAVALTTDGEFAGHAAIIGPEDGATCAEIGMAVVKPEFRAQGCLLQLTDFLMREAETRGLTGVYVRAVTNHTFSQQVADRLGFHTCALLLGYVPSTVSFKGMSGQLSQRGAFVVHYRYIRRPVELKLYAPVRHREFTARIYSGLGVAPQFISPAGTNPTFQRSQSVMRAEASIFAPEGVVTMEIVEYGEDVAQQVSRMLKELRLQRYSLILLYLDMNNPLTFYLTQKFEDLGFFFAGALPQAFGREPLILQYLNNVPMDYKQILLHSKLSRETLDYIKRQDPNQL